MAAGPDLVNSYVLRRLVAIVALAFGISVVVFLIIRLIPGDPAIALLGTSAGDKAVVERLRQQLGLDLPMPVQYWHWISNLLRGDFGYSYGYQQSVSSLLAANFPATIQLTMAGLALSLTFGMLLGIAAALRRNRAVDTAITLGAGPRRIIARHIVPSVFSGIIVLTTTWFGIAAL